MGRSILDLGYLGGLGAGWIGAPVGKSCVGLVLGFGCDWIELGFVVPCVFVVFRSRGHCI